MKQTNSSSYTKSLIKGINQEKTSLIEGNFTNFASPIERFYIFLPLEISKAIRYD